MNKKKILILSIVGIFLILVGTYFVGRSSATIDSTMLKDQEVESLSFTDASFNFENGVSTLKVKVNNNSKGDYTLKNITISFIQKDDTTIEMIGYIGPVINSGDTIEMTASIDKDLTSSKKIEYTINK